MIVLCLIGAFVVAAGCALLAIKPWVRPQIDGDDPEEIQTVFNGS